MIRHWMSRGMHVLFSWMLLTITATGRLVNVTIDDEFGDQFNPDNKFQYSPFANWNAGLYSAPSASTAKPDGSRAFDSTWHDNTVIPQNMSVANASVGFNGTAVYVFCIIADSSNSPDGHSDMEFYIDNVSMGNFTRAPTNTGDYFYNASVFSTDQLSPGPHQLTIQNGKVGGQKALILLDYVVYTYDDGGPHRPSSGVVAAISVGSAAGLALILAGFYFTWKYRRRSHMGPPSPMNGALSPEPFVEWQQYPTIHQSTGSFVSLSRGAPSTAPCQGQSGSYFSSSYFPSPPPSIDADPGLFSGPPVPSTKSTIPTFAMRSDRMHIPVPPSFVDTGPGRFSGPPIPSTKSSIPVSSIRMSGVRVPQSEGGQTPQASSSSHSGSDEPPPAYVNERHSRRPRRAKGSPSSGPRQLPAVSPSLEKTR